MTDILGRGYQGTSGLIQVVWAEDIRHPIDIEVVFTEDLQRDFY